MKRAVFLSASVPDPQRDPTYHLTADPIAIRDAVRALVTIVLPRARLVWGGHPAITPLVKVIAEDVGIIEEDSIRLYQSNFWRGKFPPENAVFQRVVKTRAARNDREKSLEIMRRAMITSEKFAGAIFVGGMEGVEVEYELFRKLHPTAKAWPIASTGGAALRIFERHRHSLPPDVARELTENLAYPSLFRRLLRFLT